jgi:hypothetical protein
MTTKDRSAQILWYPGHELILRDIERLLKASRDVLTESTG